MDRRALIGRSIVAIDLDPQMVEGEELTSPTIVLDDGSKLLFWSQESPDGGEPGVGMTVGYTKRHRPIFTIHFLSDEVRALNDLLDLAAPHIASASATHNSRWKKVAGAAANKVGEALREVRRRTKTK